MVLADGGVCCIDEFGLVPEKDRVAIHECMEQQTLSVAKAGLLTTLPTRTTIFAITNPKGGTFYHTKAYRDDLSSVTGIGGPLLSRFDVVLLLLDARIPQLDLAVSTHVLRTHQRAAHVGGTRTGTRGTRGTRGGKTRKLARRRATPGVEEGPEEDQPDDDDDDDEEEDGRQRRRPRSDPCPRLTWTTDRLRRYVAWCKSIVPTMSDPAERVLKCFYLAHRGAPGRDVARTTIRMLESAVRLAQAHARLLGRGTVTVMDAVHAILITECQKPTSALVGDTAPYMGELADDPDGDYARLEARVLAQLDAELGRPQGLLAGDVLLQIEDGRGDDDDGGGGVGGGRGDGVSGRWTR